MPVVNFFLRVAYFCPFIYIMLDSTLFLCYFHILQIRDHRSHDHMVVGFTTTCVLGAYHHLSCEFDYADGDEYLIQHYMIKFVSGLRQVVGFHWVLRFPPPK